MFARVVGSYLSLGRIGAQPLLTLISELLLTLLLFLILLLADRRRR
jgi:hypothetical protein